MNGFSSATEIQTNNNKPCQDLLPIKRNTAYLKDKKNDDLNMASALYKGQ